ncbi:pectate lyase superfamily protein-domain-containing protein [Cercophora newfieldiana]|uniref:Pectate lyase superfamily protein-domain-containing protein n=1 Tax=Cercophora newfieldiana TaxID=92897 RepID=A0AA39XZA4_9PEZI|nr:pectate lyase superfamily protein-domain-containing protein [Cercophora newfieldiana]
MAVPWAFYSSDRAQCGAWNGLWRVEIQQRQSCPAPVAGSPKTWWRAEIAHDGTTPYSIDPTFQYYRNVLSYGADNTGVRDSSVAFNDAIHAWQRAGNTVTTRPAYIYVPPGNYLIAKPIQLLVSTSLIGDAVNPPTLLAAPSLRTEPVIHGYDPFQGENGPTKNFYMAVRNFRIDTSRVESGVQARGVEWSVSQGCSLTNVHVGMPVGSMHVGVSMSYGGSAVVIADCTLTGGQTGLQIASQQYLVKNLTFTRCTTGIYLKWSHVTTIQHCAFVSCRYAIDASREGSAGTVSVVDSVAENCEVGVLVFVTGTGQNSLVLDGFGVRGGGVAVQEGGGRVLRGGSVLQGESWVLGNTRPDGYKGGVVYEGRRAGKLMGEGGRYFVKALPQYEGWEGRVVSVKGDKEWKVYGDDQHDDGPAINAILRKHAGCSVIFFPQGIYRTSETIYVPPGSRIAGEVFSTITGAGSHFNNPSSPQPIVQLGRPGESGTAQLSDMLISVADVLPGAVLLEINLASPHPGDVGLWNTVLRVGGSADSLVTPKCAAPDPGACKAAFALLHITPSASAYLEGVWGWVADHGLDPTVNPNVNTNPQNIAVGRGALIESSAPVWLVGTSFEHCVLYQYALHNASNVYIALQQTESPYWQGAGSPYAAPAPWDVNPAYGDPTFAHCALADGQCRRAWAMYVSDAENVTIHGSALWVFFNGMRDGLLGDANFGVENAAGMYWYGMATKGGENMVWDVTETEGNGNVTVATQRESKGGWGGVVAAYLRDAAESE